MAISTIFNAKSMIFIGLVMLYGVAKIEGAFNRRILSGEKPGFSGGSVKIFDVTKYGAQGDGKKDSTSGFMQAWVAACKNNTSPAKIIVPKGNFVISPVVFQGPCKSSVPITVQVVGNVTATSDLSEYSDDQWILFTRIESGVTLTGGGTFDGKGEEAWQYNDCKKGSDCNMPTSIKFMHVNNTIVSNITSVNSKFFHFHVTDCSNFTAYNLKIIAPAESPNTDGIHLSDTDRVVIKDSHIGTGDDCISIGQGVVDANITNIFCGPGHGLSIGSLGKREKEADVNGVSIHNCTLSNTDNGVRIKTFVDSPPGNAIGIYFTNIIMDNVKNPIIIDQLYGAKKNSKGVKTSDKPSHVKVNDVAFKNITGTSISDVAVSMYCSSAVPCSGIKMENINLSFNGEKGDGKIEKGESITSECSNAKITYKGTQNPPPCKQ